MRPIRCRPRTRELEPRCPDAQWEVSAALVAQWVDLEVPVVRWEVLAAPVAEWVALEGQVAQ